MPEIILHHYPRSPFAQKIRAVLGAKDLAWRSVIIPDIMPKPDVVALTGGYRRTPILQIGADIYCDTSLIAQVLDKLTTQTPLYPASQKFSATALANWADTILFPLAVALVFQPKVVEKNFAGRPPEQVKAFLEDRAAMRKGGNARRATLPEAYAVFPNHLQNLDAELSDGREFVLGDAPTIADFALYHPCWFVRRAPVVTELFDPHANVLAWLARMDSFGHGRPSELTSTDAIAIANDSDSVVGEASCEDENFSAGEQVQVAPTDYGVDPVVGELVLCNGNEVAVRRTDERAGEVTVHFPRFGYAMKAAAGS